MPFDESFEARLQSREIEGAVQAKGHRHGIKGASGVPAVEEPEPLLRIGEGRRPTIHPGSNRPKLSDHSAVVVQEGARKRLALPQKPSARHPGYTLAHS